jgi:uncharacterized protein
MYGQCNVKKDLSFFMPIFFASLFVLTLLTTSVAQGQPSNVSKLVSEKAKGLNAQAFAAYESNDIKASYKFYAQAAKLKEPSALYNVAVMRIQNETKKPTLSEAIKMLQTSALAGFAPAQFMLASLYETGMAIGQEKRSLEKSYVWYLKAAEQNHPDATLAVGTSYFLGRGTVLDYTKAAHWYLKAAQQGDAAAQYLVASMFESATGVPKDLQTALEWYVAAARQGDIAAREKSKYITELLAKERQS